MFPRRIVLLQGHPDRDAHHFGHALAARYADGAHAAGIVGIGPVHRTLIGMVEGMTERRRARRLESLHDLGAQGA